MCCEVSYEELALFEGCELPEERARLLEKHIESCAACRKRLRAIRKIDLLLSRLPPARPDAAAEGRMRRALAAETGATQFPEIMTLEEVAEFLRVTADEMAEVMEDLPAFEIGGRIRVRKARLLEWIEERERAYMKGSIESEVSRMLAGF